MEDFLHIINPNRQYSYFGLVFLKATLDFALDRKDLRDSVQAYIKQLSK